MGRPSGNEVLCRLLERLGVGFVFGVPGTQNVALFEALRKSSIRTVLTTSELGAAFMAIGYARTSGSVGVVATIPGPGFVWALPGLAEARQDSVPLLHLVGRPASAPGSKFQLQALDQAAVAGPLVKGVVEVERAADMWRAAERAYRLTRSGEPGPVVLHVAEGAAVGESEGLPEAAAAPPGEGEDTAAVGEALGFSRSARRPVIFAGLGAQGAAAAVRELAERWCAPVFTTPAARGLMPEDHPLALGFDPVKGGTADLNELLATSDLVIALGCKMSHNGTAGFQLSLPEDRLVHVNTDPEALGANYEARLQVCGDAGIVTSRLLNELERAGEASSWTEEEIRVWRDRIRRARAAGLPEPALPDLEPPTAEHLFGRLRDALPRDAIVVTDSGLHQVLARRHFEVRYPGGLLTPSDFQSMGFGIPSAIGARLASGDRPVVAVVGDGGLGMTGLELLTACREGIPVTVMVLNDGYLGLIRLQQYRDFGRAYAVELQAPLMEALAEAVGARYRAVLRDPAEVVAEALASGAPTLLEVRVGDSARIRALRVTRGSKNLAAGLLGQRLVGWLNRFRTRGEGA